MKLKFIGFNENHLSELVRIHRISFKDHFNSRLGSSYAKAFIRWFGTSNEYDNIFICAVDGETEQLVGYICGARDGYSTSMNKKLMRLIIFSFLLRPWLIFDRRFYELFGPKLKSILGRSEYPDFNEFEQKLPQPIFSVTSFALEPEYRNAGFGIFLLERLFAEFFKRMDEKKAGTIRATIRSSNKNIFKYYKSNKWLVAPYDKNSKTIRFYKEMKGN